jgi:hypothetical protein
LTVFPRAVVSSLLRDTEGARRVPFHESSRGESAPPTSWDADLAGSRSGSRDSSDSRTCDGTCVSGRTVLSGLTQTETLPESPESADSGPGGSLGPPGPSGSAKLRPVSPCILQPQPPHSVQGAVAAWRGLVEELHPSPRASVRGSSIRNRVLLACLLPALFLGATYFLLVEFVLRESAHMGEVPPLLRYGGIGLVTLFMLVSLGCGFSLADAVTRPLRTLQRIADGGEIPEGDGAGDLRARDADLHRVFLRTRMLAQQNRAGMQALEELEDLRAETAEIQRELRRCAERGGLPDPMGNDRISSPSRLARDLQGFSVELRVGLEELDSGLQRLDGRLASRERTAATGVLADLDRLERAGTIWSLNVEMIRRRSPESRDHLGACFEEFSAVLTDLRRRLRSEEESGESVDDARSEVARLRRIVAQWIKGDPEVGGANRPSAHSRGETR